MWIRFDRTRLELCPCCSTFGRRKGAADWPSFSLSLQKTTANGSSVGDAAQGAQMKVGDFMTTRVVTVHSDSPVRDAARLMLEGKITGLPVVDAGDPWRRNAITPRRTSFASRT
jgi:CBS domain